jgi:UDP-N-acetylglucosamine 2-epimerase (non-hydrolysing)/GDP/UDP-N,N'-diacetylbacillosamine 2-epimerase (hydrolysing)
VIFTQHSVATAYDRAKYEIQQSISALRELRAQGVQIIATYPNNDAGGRAIIQELEAAFTDNKAGVVLTPSLGRRNYHGLLTLARNPENRVAVLGNSSSGIKETPAFFCPTVNIGTRQKGRLRAGNVIDADYDREAILGAAKRALFDEDFRQACKSVQNPYGDGRSGERIAAVLANIELGDTLIQKRMMLAGESRDGWFR